MARLKITMPGGTLHVLDLQEEMREHASRRARAAGVENLERRQGDARHLPYAVASFDAAYLVAVLGEIPDQDAALRRRAAAAGLRLERRVGPPFGFFAVLRPEG